MKSPALTMNKKKSNLFSLCYPQGTHVFPQKKISHFNPTVWPAIANIHIYIYINMREELYYTEDLIPYKSNYI